MSSPNGNRPVWTVLTSSTGLSQDRSKSSLKRSCRCCANAVWHKKTTPKEPCVRSCLAATVCPPRTLLLNIAEHSQPSTPQSRAARGTFLMRTFAYFSAPKNNSRRGGLAPLTMLLGAAIGLTACATDTGSEVQRSVETTPADPEQPQQGGVLEYGHLQAPNCIYGGWIHENITARQMMDSLVYQPKEDEVVPSRGTD